MAAGTGPGSDRAQGVGRLSFALAAAMAASTIVQFAIGALGPTLTDEFSLSRAELGTLSAIYYLAAALLSRPAGANVDRIPPRRGLQAVFVASAAGLAAAAAAPSYGLLLLAVLPAGLAAALGNPATNRVIAQLPGQRGTVMGIKQSGVQLGALVAGAALPALAAGLGFRAALVCLASVCLAGVALTGWVPPAGLEAPAATAGATARTRGSGIGALSAYALAMGAGMSTLTTYLPLYGEDQIGFGRAAAGALLAVVAIGGIVSRVWWSRLSERRSNDAGGAAGVLLGLSLGALAATGLVLLAPTLGPGALWAGAALLGLSAAAWNAVAMLAILERVPASVTGLASGRVVTAFYLGLCLGAPVFGAVVDRSDDYRAGWALTATTFALAALAAGVARSRPGG